MCLVDVVSDGDELNVIRSERIVAPHGARGLAFSIDHAHGSEGVRRPGRTLRETGPQRIRLISWTSGWWAGLAL
jgi:hypothetical protein